MLGLDLCLRRCDVKPRIYRRKDYWHIMIDGCGYFIGNNPLLWIVEIERAEQWHQCDYKGVLGSKFLGKNFGGVINRSDL